ncbi:MAG: hypothetical protein J7M25_01665 [Deltaproteobacteria bacterium]|nr:hypothetical protein [Deltaproteobacteria bacterium]
MEAHGLDSVIEELKNRGIQAGKSKADELLADARKKADQILAEARKEAEEINAKAKAEAAKTKEQMDAELQSAAQVAMSAFRQAMLKSFALPEIDKGLETILANPKFLEQVLADLIKAFAAQKFVEGGIQVLLPEAKQKELEAYLVSRLKARAGSGVTVKFDDSLSFGFQIGPADGRFVLDLSDAGFRQIFESFMSPRFRKYFSDASAKKK